MSARDDYPVDHLHADVRGEIERMYDEIDALREALRRHVVDWGRCTDPDNCACSDATARRLLGGGL